MKIIPAINCSDFSCLTHRFLEASQFLKEGDWLHVDITDAKFTYNKTWNNPEELFKLLISHKELKKFNLEIHLMIEEPEEEIKKWVKVGAKRVIVHIEAIADQNFREKPADPKAVIAKIFHAAQQGKSEVMLSSNPETRLQDFKEYLDYFSLFQVLAVKPGLAGQIFLPTVISKIIFLRQQFPNATIEVDGGINLETGKLAKEAGADILIAASYIFGSSDQKKAYRELEKV